MVGDVEDRRWRCVCSSRLWSCTEEIVDLGHRVCQPVVDRRCVGSRIEQRAWQVVRRWQAVAHAACHQECAHEILLQIKSVVVVKVRQLPDEVERVHVQPRLAETGCRFGERPERRGAITACEQRNDWLIYLLTTRSIHGVCVRDRCSVQSRNNHVECRRNHVDCEPCNLRRCKGTGLQRRRRRRRDGVAAAVAEAGNPAAVAEC